MNEIEIFFSLNYNKKVFGFLIKRMNETLKKKLIEFILIIWVLFHTKIAKLEKKKNK